MSSEKTKNKYYSTALKIKIKIKIKKEEGRKIIIFMRD